MACLHKANIVTKISVGLAFILLAIMVFRFEINWDEFFVLNYMYRYQAGELTNPLQTIFVHGFGWLRNFGGSEITQIIAGRLVILTAFGMTCAMIFLISKRYYSAGAGLAAVLAYISFTFVFRSAFSFRVDGLLTAVLMIVLWLVSDPKQNGFKVILAGVLIGLSGLLSMKAVFYTPIIAAFLLMRWASSAWQFRRFAEGALMFIAAMLSFTLLYWLHGKTLPPNSSGLEYAAQMGGASLLSGGLFPQSRIFLIGLIQNPVFWILIGFGYVAIRERASCASKDVRVQSLAQIAFVFPLLCLLFYRHTHPYFYVFMLAPVSILCAAAVQHFIIDKRPRALPALIGILMFWISGTFYFSMAQNQDYQRQTINLVHEIFPAPVPYLDYCAMISSYPRIQEGGIFINTQTLDMNAYYQAGKPIMGDILKRRQPNFLLANVTGLDLEGRDKHANINDLLPADVEILKDNFAWFWGPIYLPAKSIAASDSEMKILIPGRYTYSGSPVQFDGRELNDGDVIELAAKTYPVSSKQGGILKWGQNLSPPTTPAPDQMLFRGF